MVVLQLSVSVKMLLALEVWDGKLKTGLALMQGAGAAAVVRGPSRLTVVQTANALFDNVQSPRVACLQVVDGSGTSSVPFVFVANTSLLVAELGTSKLAEPMVTDEFVEMAVVRVAVALTDSMTLALPTGSQVCTVVEASWTLFLLDNTVVLPDTGALRRLGGGGVGVLSSADIAERLDGEVPKLVNH
jgi:hypothetical protein